MPKYHSYKAAFERIKDAIGKGFYFEAVALCESIMSDRLLSFVKGDSDAKVSVRTGFGELISKTRNLQPALSALWDELDEWRKSRNTVVHGFAKSEPTEPTTEVAVALASAEKTAREGVTLTTKVCGWHKKQLRKHKREIKKAKTL